MPAADIYFRRYCRFFFFTLPLHDIDAPRAFAIFHFLRRRFIDTSSCQFNARRQQYGATTGHKWRYAATPLRRFRRRLLISPFSSDDFFFRFDICRQRKARRCQPPARAAAYFLPCLFDMLLMMPLAMPPILPLTLRHVFADAFS